MKTILSDRKTSVALLSALSLFCSETTLHNPQITDRLPEAGEVEKSRADLVKAEHLEKIKDQILEIDKKEKDRFSGTIGIINAIIKDQIQQGYDEGNSVLACALLQVRIASDIDKRLNEAGQDRFLKMDRTEFTQYLLGRKLSFSFEHITGGDNTRYFGDFSLTRLAEPPSAARYKEIFLKTRNELAKLGFLSPEEITQTRCMFIQSQILSTENSPNIYRVGEIQKLPKAAVILIDPKPLSLYKQRLPSFNSSSYLAGTLANEFAHVRNLLCFPGKNPVEEHEVILSRKTVKVPWIEMDEAFSDMATYLIANPKDTKHLAFFLSQQIAAGRSKAYSLSAEIVKDAAWRVFGEKFENIERIAADESNESRVEELAAACETLIKEQPKFLRVCIATYADTLKNLGNWQPNKRR